MKNKEVYNACTAPYGGEVYVECNVSIKQSNSVVLCCTQAQGHSGPHVSMCYDTPHAIWIDTGADFRRLDGLAEGEGYDDDTSEVNDVN